MQLLGRKQRPELKPPDCIARYVCIKHSWRGKYKRIFCITPTAVHTQNPERTLVLTNTYVFAGAGESDIDGVTLGADDAEFVVSARQDKRSKYKPIKFTCRHRTLLLTDLYQCMAAAAALSRCSIAAKILGSPQDFAGMRYSKGTWVPTTLRLVSYGLEAIEPGSGTVLWRCDYHAFGSPGCMVLASSQEAEGQDGIFAVLSRLSRKPKVFACRARDSVLGGLQAAAKKRLGHKVTMDGSGSTTVQQLLQAIMHAERSHSSQASELPLGQWEVERLKARHDVVPPQLVQCLPTLSARRMTMDAMAGMQELMGAAGANMVARRLVVTPSSLLERRVDSHEVVCRAPLANVAALVRFAEDPKLLGLEWEDGSPPAVFVSPARDAVLACILDAAQAAAGRPIPLMPGWTHPGDSIITTHKHASHSPHTEPEPDLQALYLGELSSRAAQAHAVLSSGGHLAFQQPPTPQSLASSSPRGSDSALSSSPSSFTGPASAPSKSGLSALGAAFGQHSTAAATNGTTSSSAKEALTPQEAVDVMMECIYELNACVPYAGVTAEGELDPVALACCCALLPEELQISGVALQLSPEDAKQAIAVLHCLQRLAAAPKLAEGLLATPGALSRVFAALACPHEPVAVEAARLLTRLFAPAAARRGAAPWMMLRGAAIALPNREDPATSNSIVDNSTAKSAKLLAFTPALTPTRIAALLAPMKRETPALPLLAMAVVEAVTAVACEPGSVTTDTALLEALLQACAAVGRPLFSLFSHPAARVADGAAVLMRAVASCGAAAAAPMREAALREGAMLHHLHLAMFAPGAKGKLSQELVASWADEYAPALALLRRVFPPGLVRYLNSPKAPQRKAPAPAAATPAAAAAPAASIAQNQQAGGAAPATAADVAAPLLQVAHREAAGPAGPLALTTGTPGSQPSPNSADPLSGAAVSSAAGPLSSQPQSNGIAHTNPGAVAAEQAPAAQAAASTALQQQQQQQLQDSASTAPSDVAAGLMAQVTGDLKGNWQAFWSALSGDHCHAGLIWNETTRLELKEALEKEESGLRGRRQRVAQGSHRSPSWNYSEFNVEYPSLSRQLCIGGVFVRLLLEGSDPGGIDKLVAPKEFFMACYHAFLRAASSDTAMAPISPATQRLATTNSSTSSSSSTRSADAQPQAVQELCVKAMAAAYSAHAGTIGPFEGIPHLLRVMDLTLQRSLRHVLLQLVQALVMPRAAAAPSSSNSSGSNSADASSVSSGGRFAAQQAAALRAAKANGYLLMDNGGLELLVDVVADAHECGERRLLGTGGQVAGAGSLLTSISHAEAPKEWYFYPNGYHPEGLSASRSSSSTPLPAAAQVDTAQTSTSVSTEHPADEAGRAGPISRDELKRLVTKGRLSWSTLMWAAGLPYPQPLWEIRELRWSLSNGAPLSAPFQLAATALACLQQLADLQPAAEADGSPLQPLPRVHRSLASQRCLPHIAQVMLTGEPALVAAAARLLETVLAHHEEALPRLYLTGAFFFALAYCGSNLVEVARLFKTAHLQQHFRGPQELAAGLPLAQRSYLGALLPESMLFVLESYGAAVFAEALAGDHDTPELIWTHKMRGQRLVPMLMQHLGDFPHRLREHHHAVYEYTPMPPISWPELSEEIWCHRYYLRNLCDEERCKDWVIVDHIPLLQALLAQWRTELARKPLAMSESDACAVLGITPGPSGMVSEEEMRRAYRQLARKHHPDKNPDPASRAKFLQIQKAYERLQVGAEGGQGPQAWRLLLMLRAQVILFKRYSEVLQPFKYAGYMQLLEVVRQTLPAVAATTPAASAASTGAPASPSTTTTHTVGTAQQQQHQHFLSPERVQQVQAAIELCWVTCVCSALNAEELIRSGGISVLGALLCRCVDILPADAAPNGAEAVIATNALRTFAGMAAAEVAWKELEAQRQLVADIVKCCSLERCPAAVDAALIAICHMAASAPLQQLLLESGALAHIIPLLLQYDATLTPEAASKLALPFSPDDVSGSSSFAVLDTPLLRPNMQEAKSQHALLAARALARLSGALPGPHRTPVCAAAQSALKALLTESLAGKLGDADPRLLLGQLSSSLETAQVIWNNAMHEELLKALHAQRERGTDLVALHAFTFRSLQNELQIGGVFVRVFNRRAAAGGASSAAAGATTSGRAPETAAAAAAASAAVPPSADSPAFCKGLVRFLFERLVERSFRGAELWRLSASERSDVLDVLTALGLLLEREPRLLGLLASRSALSPLVCALLPAFGSWPSLQERAAKADDATSSPAAGAAAAAAPAAATSETAQDGTSGRVESDDGSSASAERSNGITSTSGSGAVSSGGGGVATTRPTTAPRTAAEWAAVAQSAEELASQALSLLARVTQNAACAGALVDEPFLRLLFWGTHQPPSFRCLSRTLALLRSLSGHAAAASIAGYQGGALLLLSVLLHSGQWPWAVVGGQAPSPAEEEGVKVVAAGALGRLMQQPTHGPRVGLLLGKLLPPGLVAAVEEGPPEAVLRALTQAVETPECLWDIHMASAAAAEAATFASAIRAQHAAGTFEWAPPPSYTLQFDKLRGEMFVGGVYVRFFLKNPKYPIRDPVKFVEGLMERYLQALAAAAPATAAATASARAAAAPSVAANGVSGAPTPGAAAPAAVEAALLLSAAAVALLKGHGLLSDHVAQLGYTSRLLANLAACTAAITAAAPSTPTAAAKAAAAAPSTAEPTSSSTGSPQAPPDELGGSILRLLHQLSASSSAAEALTTATAAPVAPTLASAMAWGHAATILVLETLKRMLSIANRQRDGLVGQALSAGLVPRLLKLLDWRSGDAAGGGEGGAAGGAGGGLLGEEQEFAVQRTLAVDVLRLMTHEGAYSAQVLGLLHKSDVWSAYRDQRHDMFLPSGATAESGVVGLLTAGVASTYALPAPEAP